MNLIDNTFESGELAPDLAGRIDLPEYYQGARKMENSAVAPGRGTVRRPGFEVIRTGYQPEVPEVPTTYTYTWFSENATLWGVPVWDGVIRGLDANGVARDVGGGIVGLPYAGNPFAPGDTIYVEGTTWYEGVHTLTEGTTATELQFARSFDAETFDGTETVIRRVGLPQSGNGSAVRDSAGNIYYGHVWDDTNHTGITKMTPDGTFIYDFLTWPQGETHIGHAVTVALSGDEQDLYAYVRGNVNCVIRFDLSTGAAVWQKTFTYPGYDMAIDADGNAYAIGASQKVYRFDAADGTMTEIESLSTPAGTYSGLIWAWLVDDTLGIVIGGGYTYDSTSDEEGVAALYNLGVAALDNGASDTIRLGTTYEEGSITFTRDVAKGCIASDGEYIYVLTQYDTPASIIHKLSWNGNTLTEVSSADGPPYGIGLFFDPWGNLCVVNQDSYAHRTDWLWFYDRGLTFLRKCENLYSGALLLWGPPIGRFYIEGNALRNGEIGTPAQEEAWTDIEPVEV
jgi:hypothetical protein